MSHVPAQGAHQPLSAFCSWEAESWDGSWCQGQIPLRGHHSVFRCQPGGRSRQGTPTTLGREAGRAGRPGTRDLASGRRAADSGRVAVRVTNGGRGWSLSCWRVLLWEDDTRRTVQAGLRGGTLEAVTTVPGAAWPGRENATALPRRNPTRGQSAHNRQPPGLPENPIDFHPQRIDLLSPRPPVPKAEGATQVLSQHTTGSCCARTSTGFARPPGPTRPSWTTSCVASDGI